MPEPAGRARLMLADDHAMVVQGLRAALETDYDIVAVVQDGNDVLEAARAHRPDVVLLDLSLPNRPGMELLPALVAEGHAVLIVSMHADRQLVDMASSLGASGFVPKNAELEELDVAIREVLAGRRYVSPKLPSRGTRGRHSRIGFERLTPRQQEVVRLIGRGLSSQQIGEALGVSQHTVHFHRTNIRRVLGIESDFEMMRYAILVLQEEGAAPPPAVER